MSEIPSFDLQAAIATALRGDAELRALTGATPARFYDEVPGEAVFPYGNLGDEQENPDLADCLDGAEVFVTLHFWARNNGVTAARPMVKKLVGRAMTVLLDGFEAGTLTLTSHRLVDFTLGSPSLRILRDPDGLTAHGVLSFRALTEPL